jgi:type IV pilus assembly protein PilE
MQARVHWGFSLIEVMVVVVIIAILAMIALPSYEAYTRRAHIAQVQQEMQKIAEQLERYKGRNFSYNGFSFSGLYGQLITTYDDALGEVYVPLGSTKNTARYIIRLVDADTDKPLAETKRADEGTVDQNLGHAWKMNAVRVNSTRANLKGFVLTSTGERCQSTNANMISLFNCVSSSGQRGDAW